MSVVVAKESTPQPTHRWVRLRPALIAALMLGLVGGVVAAGWWWTHPQVLNSQFGNGGAYRAPGEEVYMALADVDPLGAGEVLQFSGVRIDRGPVSIDFEDADLDRELKAEVFVCVEDADDSISLGDGAPEELRDYCTDVRPLLPGGRLDGRDQAESLFLRLSAEPRGLFEVDGVSLDYRRAGTFSQRGTQHIDVDFTFNTRDRMPD